MSIVKPNNNTLSAITSLPSGVGGKVLQVIHGTDETLRETTSTSFATLTLNASITPSATSSKILLLYHAQISNTDSESQTSYAQCRVLRDSTTVSESTRLNGYLYLAHDMWNMSVLDSPSSTSALTYKVQIMSGSSNVHFSCPHNVNECGITLMEILA